MLVRITGQIPYLNSREDALSEKIRLEQDMQKLGEISSLFEQPNRFSILRKQMKDIIESLNDTYPK